MILVDASKDLAVLELTASGLPIVSLDLTWGAGCLGLCHSSSRTLPHANVSSLVPGLDILEVLVMVSQNRLP